MKVVLDLTELVAEGKLTAAEAERLKGLAARDTGALGVNILLAFGTVAVALGAGVLVPDLWTVVILGAALFAVGFGLTLAQETRWSLFAQITMTIGALSAGGALWALTEGNLGLNALVVLGLAVAAGLTRSGLLAALAVLGLTALLGGATAYWHATYAVSILQPTLTILALAMVALIGLVASQHVPPDYRRVTLIAARAATLLINLAFLVGSLFGDQTPYFALSPVVFSVVWALLLLGVGFWGVVANRRWVVNTAAVFGGIHFYTQWFETLGASPVSILGGGLLLIAFGFGLKVLNARFAG
jgi:hypothetical protein